jgi:Na+/H+-dicarboxylate symporter
MKQQALIAIGLVTGLLVGVIADLSASDLLRGFAENVAPIGTAFVRLVRMVVIPLVVVTIFSGVAGLADPRRLGKLGGTALILFWISSFIAIAIGMGVMALALEISPVSPLESPVGEHVRPELPGTIDFLLGLIPANPFAAAANGDLLPLVVFTVLFAAAAGALPREKTHLLADVADAAGAALIKMVHWVLWTAPVGVFALAASMAAEGGLSTLKDLAVLVAAVAAGLVIFIALVYLPMVAVLGRMKPRLFLRSSLTPQVIALSTTSSIATLPAMLEAAEQRLGVSRPVAGLVLSLGASLNRAGSALFQGSALVFLAALYDVPLSIPVLGGAMLAVFLASLTVASVPSASVVTLTPALDVTGIPTSGLAILLGIDRIPDMLRTATNVTGHLAAATVVQRTATSSGLDQEERDEPPHK